MTAESFAQRRHSCSGFPLSPVPCFLPFDQERLRVADHGTKHAANFSVELGQLAVLLTGDVPAVHCEVQGSIGFICLPITISQFAHKVGIIPALRPLRGRSPVACLKMLLR